jgi:hypothetical protein
VSVVISRETWDPQSANGCSYIGTSEWELAGRELWLHHSITNPPGADATLAQDAQHMRDFEAIGQSRFGCGISYTWVVMPSGRILQGHDVDRQGTHTYGRNDRSRAICLAGNFDVHELPNRMRNAVALLLRELGATLDGGHRDVYPTACPGAYAYAKIGEINSLALSGVPLEEDDVPTTGEIWGHGIEDPNQPGVDYPAYDWLRYARVKAGEALDMGHQVKAEVEITQGKLDALAAVVAELQLSGVPVDVELSDADVDRVALRLANFLGARLAD